MLFAAIKRRMLKDERGIGCCDESAMSAAMNSVWRENWCCDCLLHDYATRKYHN